MDKLKVVKIGGNVIDNPEMLTAFLKDFAALEGAKILVHGGGKKASEISRGIGHEPKMVDGRRITEEKDLEIITMVYGGLISKNIVAQLQALNCTALGLSGADGNSITSVKRPVNPIDFGFVGDVIAVNADFIHGLIQQGIAPVYCAITHDNNGQLFNTNADTIAAELAVGLSKYYETELIYCFEKKGVLEDVDDEDSAIPEINTASYESLKKEGKIHSGMLPKLHNCFDALERNVNVVKIGSTDMLKSGNEIYTKLKL